MNDIVFVLLEDQIALTHAEAYDQGLNPERLLETEANSSIDPKVVHQGFGPLIQASGLPTPFSEGQKQSSMDTDKKGSPKEPENDVYAYAYVFEDILDDRKRDWEGIGRDRRSAYQVIGALKAENII
ncbi:hypothetical protein EST38_g8558 [Candolleomyces aberdarensis]|uniref:Uncharacterized protein n=1 Tax=Candolleomyces aberdarensis TaxID=2316362 RepID=A0A4Q2DFM2_9AGAR|nr:hypothetical protein EST38_g8558 [Candolleomyces aberdarensis]